MINTNQKQKKANKIISRYFINSDITFEEVDDSEKKKNLKKYTFDDLCKKINCIKNSLIKDLSKSENSAIIGLPAGIDQTACVFACLELGISITIIDYDRPDLFAEYEYMDPKTDILSPVDFFIIKNAHYGDTDSKYQFFKKRTRITVSLSKVLDGDYTPNNIILANENTEAIRCTSSGTTGTPKRISHTHEFIFAISKRNSKFFDKTVGLAYNLNHGSSIATYFLPALHSSSVNKFVHLIQMHKKHYYMNVCSQINHLMIPYQPHIQYLSRKFWKDLTVYTLSTIPKLNKIETKFKDIVSFFGSNETSGPTLINRLSFDSYENNAYEKIDNFYELKLKNSRLHVTIPIYNHEHNTKDVFIKKNTKYIFKGRNDLYRINGYTVDIVRLEGIVKKNFKKFNIVLDTVQHEIYLAIWENTNNLLEKVEKINRLLIPQHAIKKASILNKDEFIYGVKLDQELLREYFRQHVKTIIK